MHSPRRFDISSCMLCVVFFFSSLLSVGCRIHSLRYDIYTGKKMSVASVNVTFVLAISKLMCGARVFARTVGYVCASMVVVVRWRFDDGVNPKSSRELTATTDMVTLWREC